MARIEFAARVQSDLDRIKAYLEEHASTEAATRLKEIRQAFAILSANPEIGRPAGPRGKRELVIGKRRQGYVAAYRYLESSETVKILAIRSQREAGFSDR